MGGRYEQCEHLAVDGGLILMLTYEPEDAPRGAVVFCGSLFDEMGVHSRRETYVARRLANAGFVCARLHYRGTGNSDDVVDGFTAQTLREDVLEVGRVLTRRFRPPTFTYLGVRAGALTAASAAAQDPRADLVLWEPPAGGRAYLREMARASGVADLKAGRTGKRDLERELAQAGSVELLAHDVQRATYDSLRTWALAASFPGRARRILLLQQSRATELKQAYRSLVSDWGRAGHDVATHVVQEAQAWWFVSDQWVSLDAEPATEEITGVLLRWAHGGTAGAAR